METKSLEMAGLSPNETKCYMALLKIGSASANEISRKSGIHRVSVYDALRGLREKGLISQIMKSNKLLFEAANPERIFDIIKEKQEIHSFKGLAGIKTILQAMLNSKTEILDFGAEYKIKEFLPYDYKKWDKERIKRKIQMRIVASLSIKT